MTALNDVWTLDVANMDKLRWDKVQTWGKKKPTPRGYHTANLTGHHMVIVGGSDGADCFSEIWFLNLGECIRDMAIIVLTSNRDP